MSNFFSMMFQLFPVYTFSIIEECYNFRECNTLSPRRIDLDRVVFIQFLGQKVAVTEKKGPYKLLNNHA